MEISQLKDYIISNPDLIEGILDSAKFFQIKSKGDKWWCGWNYDTSGTTIYVSKATLASVDFARGIKGDIITLLESKLSLGFSGTVKWLCTELGLEYNKEPIKIHRPFGGYYMNCDVNKEEQLIEVIEYPRKILTEYSQVGNMMFFKDGITFDTQQEFTVGFDPLSGRITIPIFDEKGRLIGVDSRANAREVNSYKWFPLIPFKKSQVLFGYSKNYHNIANGITIIGESPKSVMQLRSMGINNGVALGCASVTDINAKNLQSLFSNEYILMMDEGLEEEYIREQAKKIKIDNPFIKNKVTYIWDEDNIVLKKNSKDSPTDLGKDKLRWLIANCRKEV